LLQVASEPTKVQSKPSQAKPSQSQESMLSVKTATNLSSMASHHHHEPSHHSSFSRGHDDEAACRRLTLTAEDSMMMSMGDSPASSSSSIHRSSGEDDDDVRLLKRTTTTKSSYALTSLLLEQQQQQQPQQHDVPTPLTNTSFTLAMAANVVGMSGPVTPTEFGMALQTATTRTRTIPQDDNNKNHHEQPYEEETLDLGLLRQVLELPLRQARKRRDASRLPYVFAADHNNNINVNTMMMTPLTSWIDLPYPSLRDERAFLYDHRHTHPLASVLCQTLQVSKLHQLHHTWNPLVQTAKDHQRQLVTPLLDKLQRHDFRQAYESFVTSCCIPLLHAAALRAKDVFPTGPAGVVYRYQVFPTITMVYPNDPLACQPPTCDLSRGNSVAWLHFHVPLTASVGTSAIYCERYPGKEDWHPLRCTSVGLGYCWDGARCLSFVPLNTTPHTRVSLDFRILLCHNNNNKSSAMNNTTSSSSLVCQPHHLLQDSLTATRPGFYEEATMDHDALASRILQRRRSSAGSSNNSNNNERVEPDERCGFPFA
jgi:hypothetical protein